MCQHLNLYKKLTNRDLVGLIIRLGVSQLKC
nr:MAG TPA: hypothetical protein [Caudoviricetes sp.]